MGGYRSASRGMDAPLRAAKWKIRAVTSPATRWWRGPLLSAAQTTGELWRSAVKPFVTGWTRGARRHAFRVRPCSAAVFGLGHRGKTRLAGLWCFTGHKMHLSSENHHGANRPRAVRQKGVTASCPLSGCSSGRNTWDGCGRVKRACPSSASSCLSESRIHHRPIPVKRTGWGDSQNAHFYIRAKCDPFESDTHDNARIWP